MKKNRSAGKKNRDFRENKMKFSKETLSKIILEETIDFLEEISEKSNEMQELYDHVNQSFEVIETNRQKLESFRVHTEERMQTLAKFISGLMDDRDKIKRDMSAVKEQIPGLERTVQTPAAGIPLIPPDERGEATKTTNYKPSRERVAENKKSFLLARP